MRESFIVTGSQGFIGRNLVKRLGSLGHGARCFDLRDYQSVDSMWRQVEKSIRSHRCTGIFHVGALTDTLSKRTNHMLSVNAEFTADLSNLARSFSIPLVYSSSAANYGVDGRRPSNLYGWSKYLGEKAVIANGQVALRYFNVFGPGESDKGAMASFLYQAFNRRLQGTRVLIFPGTPRRDFIHVDDVVNANVLALQSYSKIRGNIFDVGMGKSTSFEQILDWSGIPFDYEEESAIPSGYQFYTRANKQNFIPHWNAGKNLKQRVVSYIAHLSGS